ncbi:MAG: N-succinylarginine dihydrolase [Pseudomonadota bacterium]
MDDTAGEVNFDGLVGPTHNYAGLAYGNVASARHCHLVSNPRAAFLEGLNKAWLLADLGLRQAVLPPHERPDLEMLRRLGFSGPEPTLPASAAKSDPVLLACCYSSSAMWAANAATVSPSADTADGRVHITPANLVSQFHRSLESAFTAKVLQAVFPEPRFFAHHEPLPACFQLSDEGAANHTRLCSDFNRPGVELFVYGRRAFDHTGEQPQVFPARQSLEASAAIARLHGLRPDGTVFARQSPAPIDAGVFHNDVIAVGNGNVFFFHEQAFSDASEIVEELYSRFRSYCGEDLIVVEVSSKDVSLGDAVDSYLFNSQLISLPNGSMSLIAPVECSRSSAVKPLLDDLAAGRNPIESIRYVDVRQSMQNGGGPACLRLRVVLNDEEMRGTLTDVFLDPPLYDRLCDWGGRRYRDRLHIDDLKDPDLITESRTALDELSRILGLGSIYGFQREANQ